MPLGCAARYMPAMTYVLHYAPDNASLIIRLALEEMGLPYQTALVDRAARAQDSAAYRKINPAGRIPVLETPDGLIFETAAILLWLADRHRQMFPKPDHAGRGAALTWLFYLSNDIQAPMRQVFYADRFAGAEPAVQAAYRRPLQAQIRASLSLLERDLPGTQWCLPGAAPSILDCYLTPFLRWCMLYPVSDPGWAELANLPRLMQIAGRLEARASAQKLALAEGLGAKPFTEPRLATPPEGSAF